MNMNIKAIRNDVRADDTNKTKTQPGINKQTSNLGASGTYTDCDNIRFRYGLPEKMSGWDKTTANTLIGVVRDQHAWVALDGTRLAALAQIGFVYANDLLYDITVRRQHRS